MGHKTHVAGLRAPSTPRIVDSQATNTGASNAATDAANRNPETHLISTPKETQISSLKSGGTEHAPAPLPQSIALSDEVVLLYVLNRSGCVGQLTIGRIERGRAEPVESLRQVRGRVRVRVGRQSAELVRVPTRGNSP